MTTLAKARLNASTRCPYLSAALYAMTPVEDATLPTVAVDRWWRLYYSPEVLNAWTTEQAATALIHEVHHLIRDHAKRRGTVAPETWNIAADAEINDDLAGMPIPFEVVTPARLNQPDKLTAEQYVTAAEQHTKTKCNCGSGAGGVAHSGELGEPGEGQPGLTAVEAKSVRRAVASAVAARGTTGTDLDQWARDQLAPPVVPWTSVLRRYMSAELSRIPMDWSFARPNRRYPDSEVRLPSLVGWRPTVVAVLDTSGSMSALGPVVLGELEGLCTAIGTVRVLTGDTEVRSSGEVASAKQVSARGGGGTDMRPLIAAANKLRPSVIVVITDCYTPWPASKPRTPVIVLAPALRGQTPAWARTITVGG